MIINTKRKNTYNICKKSTSLQDKMQENNKKQNYNQKITTYKIKTKE